MFYFKLHPLQWVYESDGTTLFRALELADGRYLVSWKDNKGIITEVFYAREEVEMSLVKQHWIITDDKQQEKGFI